MHQEGSWEWYLSAYDPAINALVSSIVYSSVHPSVYDKLRGAFPHLVAAFEMDDHSKAPIGFLEAGLLAERKEGSESSTLLRRIVRLLAADDSSLGLAQLCKWMGLRSSVSDGFTIVFSPVNTSFTNGMDMDIDMARGLAIVSMCNSLDGSIAVMDTVVEGASVSAEVVCSWGSLDTVKLPQLVAERCLPLTVAGVLKSLEEVEGLEISKEKVVGQGGMFKGSVDIPGREECGLGLLIDILNMRFRSFKPHLPNGVAGLMMWEHLVNSSEVNLPPEVRDAAAYVSRNCTGGTLEAALNASA